MNAMVSPQVELLCTALKQRSFAMKRHKVLGIIDRRIQLWDVLAHELLAQPGRQTREPAEKTTWVIPETPRT